MSSTAIYDMLTRVRTHNDMMGWIKFFLEAVIETSKTAKEKFRNVVEFTMEIMYIFKTMVYGGIR